MRIRLPIEFTAESLHRLWNQHTHGMCNRVLMVERYGLGSRWACPYCDVRYLNGLPCVSWTNGPVPMGGRCSNVINTSETFGEETDVIVLQGGPE